VKVAIIGASGKTGTRLVRESLKRRYEVVALCREASEAKLNDFAGREGFRVMTAPEVSDEGTLTRVLAGCDAVVAILISAHRLKATELVKSLARATAANGVKRLVFTAGEVTAEREEGEKYTLRQSILYTVVPPIMVITPYSMADMLKSSVLIKEQAGWEWTIVRAPTLTNKPAVGYKLCRVDQVTGKHALSREDYAACILDSIRKPEHHKRLLTVISAEG